MASPPSTTSSKASTSPSHPVLSLLPNMFSTEPYKPLISPSIYHQTEEGQSRPGAPLTGQADLLNGSMYRREIVLEPIDTPSGLTQERSDPIAKPMMDPASSEGRIGSSSMRSAGPTASSTSSHQGLEARDVNEGEGSGSDFEQEVNGQGAASSSRNRPARRESKKKLIVRGLLDAPARAALNMPNGETAHKQAAAVRNSHCMASTPEFEMTPSAAMGVLKATVPLPRSVSGGRAEPGIDADLDGDVGSAGGGVEEGVYASSSSLAGRGGAGAGARLMGTGTVQGGPGDYFASLGGPSGSIAGSSSRYGTRIDTDLASSRAGSRSPSPSPMSAYGAGGIRNTLLKRIRIDRAASANQHLLRPTFPPPSLSTYSPRPPRPLVLKEWINLFFVQAASFFLSTTFLVIVVAWAVGMEIKTQVPRWLKGMDKKQIFPWDDEKYWKKNEKVSEEPRDYARAIGMDIEDQQVETEDGFYLRVHKVVDPQARKKSDGRGGFPVLILHGLFQSSGSFITSEDRSLAFWLARQGGYQVYLGNTRGVFNMGHRNLSRSDPRFWDWTIRELAMYDLPALVEHVCAETGYEKIAFIGHSQGNGLAFISLSVGMCPSLGKRISLFVALAPAVYAGPLTSGFPFTQLGKLEWHTWKRLFGVLDFIPLMRWSYDHVPSRMFASLGYVMFAYLFQWTDTNWLKRRRVKMFRFTPTPVSSASLFWWCGKGGFGTRKCTMDDTLDTWYDGRFPPLSIYYGGRDFLVLTEPLLDRLRNKEKAIDIVRVDKLDVGEHCDAFWSALSPEWVFTKLREDIEKTRLRYPEELDAKHDQ